MTGENKADRFVVCCNILGFGKEPFKNGGFSYLSCSEKNDSFAESLNVFFEDRVKMPNHLLL